MTADDTGNINTSELRMPKTHLVESICAFAAAVQEGNGTRPLADQVQTGLLCLHAGIDVRRRCSIVA